MAAKGGQWKDGAYEPAKAVQVRPGLGTVTLRKRDRSSEEVPALARHGDLALHHGVGGGYVVTHAPSGMATGHFMTKKVAAQYAQHFGAGEGVTTFAKAVAGDKAANKEMLAARERWRSADRAGVAPKQRRAAKPAPRKTLAQLGDERAKLPREALPYLRANQRVTGGRTWSGGGRYADVRWKGASYRIVNREGGRLRFMKQGVDVPVSDVPAPLRRRAEAILSGIVARQARWRNVTDSMKQHELDAFGRRTGRYALGLGGTA